MRTALVIAGKASATIAPCPNRHAVWSMKFIVPLATFLLAAAMPAHAQSSRALLAGKCETDADVPAAARAPYEETALQVVRAIVDGRYDDAHAKFDPEVLRGIRPADFSRAMSQRAQAWNPMRDLKVAQSFRLSGATGSDKGGIMLCSAEAGGSVTAPGGSVLVGANPIPLQAHVIVEGKGQSHRFAFALWLTQPEQDWRVFRLEINPTTILDRSASDLWKEARNQRERGHDFNAFVLFMAASQLTNRGPNVVLGVAREIDKELKDLQQPPEFAGGPPSTWTYGDSSFRVVSVRVTEVGADFGLLIQHEVAGSPRDEELERQNRALLAGFKVARAEYAQVFDVIVVRALSDGGRRAHGTAERTPKRQ
jgi:hypothetical protein